MNLFLVMEVVKTKICGFTNSEDAKVACDIGVDMVGVVVNVNVPTPRNITVEQAARVFDSVPEGVERVVVTTPENVNEAEDLVNELNPDFLQVHNRMYGREMEEIREKIKVIGVFHVSKDFEESAEVVSEARDIAAVSDRLLLDTKLGSGGGTGETHDWEVSSMIRDNLKVPIILAGGLNPSNVRLAIEKVRPFAVDVSSGVESEPGKKDHKLMEEFVREVGG